MRGHRVRRRVGTGCRELSDYVYFENSSSNPYLIRRIEELNKTANGNVEAKVVCFYRRRDISSTLIALADKHATLSVCYKTGPGADNGEEGELEEEMENPEMVDLPEKLKHQLRHRELFLSRQLESLPATHIRGKCSVTLLNETESLKSYLEREDFFFYSLVYDPQQKTLLADKGEIRVGNRYQADITDLLKEGEEDGRDQSRLETKVWEAHNPLIDKQIDQFLVVARSVGTFARALDCSSSVRQPSLHMSAAAASRDITLFHAMDTLHKSVYDVAKAISALVPQGGPVLCRDEMEEWSASEASLFEEALEKYGKDFTDIQQDFLPWKSLTSIIEYYYMWKTTDRYVQQKRLKAAEAESKLKQVYIPNYNKPNPNQISANNVKAGVVNGAGAPGQSPGAGRACESCYMSPLRVLLDVLEEVRWLENANPVRRREAGTKPQQHEPPRHPSPEQREPQVCHEDQTGLLPAHHQAHAHRPAPVPRDPAPVARRPPPLRAHQQCGYQGRVHGPAARSLPEPAGAEAGCAEAPGSCAAVSRDPSPPPQARPCEERIRCAWRVDPCQVGPRHQQRLPHHPGQEELRAAQRCGRQHEEASLDAQ
ncbi:metastasis-associated protein MTA1 isoform X6 [Mustela lutreola]|uniref:metastasis-associated protein MTA1 isoform X6 n=1 Tax=Mustela lutreola TaxID=9666 RepID=UPI002797A341|nr:metastasis-associated protein MTA1 isoform X6 [Mustela lutreola]XP_059039340.1 metastasis-associated protein MTA1 isoform X6 [Mustela lutreola]